MSRKQFIEAQGATCDNWAWSWSFVNHEKKFVIFGAWDTDFGSNKVQIMSENWIRNIKNKKPAGYNQSIEHIRLILEEEYALKIFYMIKGRADNGIPRINKFTAELKEKFLEKTGDDWYALDIPSIKFPEEIEMPMQYFEGAATTISVNRYERDKDARDACIKEHGCKCAVCGFDFEKTYGEIGRNYIHVHHVVPLSQIKSQYKVVPIRDLIPVCPNCHAMLHKGKELLTVEELKEILSKNNN